MLEISQKFLSLNKQTKTMSYKLASKGINRKTSNSNPLHKGKTGWQEPEVPVEIACELSLGISGVPDKRLKF